MAIEVSRPASLPRLSRNDLPPEIELLCLCGRTSLDATAVAQIRNLLEGKPDWERTLALARRHSLIPLLYRSLQAVCSGDVPADVMARLHQRYQANGWRNLIQTGELLRLLELFDDEHIRAVPFKGPVLAATIYGDINLRQFRDLDILVAEDDLARASALLQARGYAQKPHMDGVQQSDNYAYAFVHEERQHIVELHWGILPSYFAIPLQMERLWPIIEVRMVSRVTVNAVPAEYLLIILCAHGARHSWKQLLWVADVAELLRTYSSLDWPAVLALARAFGSRRILYLGLQLAHGLLDAPLPSDIRAEIRRDEAVPSLARLIEKHLESRDEGLMQDLDFYQFHLRMRERRHDKLRHLRHLVRYWLRPTARDGDVAATGGTGLQFKLRRLVRLVREYGPTLFWEFFGRGERLRPPSSETIRRREGSGS